MLKRRRRCSSEKIEEEVTEEDPFTSLTLSMPGMGLGDGGTDSSGVRSPVEEGESVGKWTEEIKGICLVSIMQEMIAREVRSYMETFMENGCFKFEPKP